MLNKSVLIVLVLLSMNQKTHENHENKVIHESNVKKLNENQQKIKTSKTELDKQIKQKNDHINKLVSYNEKFSKLDINTHKGATEYNKLKNEYEALRKKYNGDRNNACAKLPALSVLSNIKPPRNDKDYNCERWSFLAKDFGVLYGKALFYLGKQTSFAIPRKQRDHFYCTGAVYYNIVSRNKNHNHYKFCFYNNFQQTVRITVAKLNKGDKNVEISHPYKSLTRKEEAVKELIAGVKRSLPDFGKYAGHVPRFYK